MDAREKRQARIAAARAAVADRIAETGSPVDTERIAQQRAADDRFAAILAARLDPYNVRFAL